MLELCNVIGDIGSVICQTNGSHMDRSNRSSKALQLARDLLIVVFFIEWRTVWPTLLDSTLVLGGSHQLVVPLTESGTIGEPEVPVPDPLVWLGVQEEAPDEDLPKHKVEG